MGGVLARPFGFTSCIGGSVIFGGTSGLTFDKQTLTTGNTITISGTPTLTVNNTTTTFNDVVHGTGFTKAG